LAFDGGHVALRYTIKDIAAEAKVSVSTVSKCLNGYPDIGEETKQYVLRTIERMDYVPNTYARYVAHQSTKVIGLTVPDVRDPYSAQTTFGIEQQLRRAGYDLFLGSMDRSEERFLSFITTARKMRFDGLILTPESWSERACKAVSHLDVPVLSIRREPPQGSGIPYIDCDHRKGAQKIMEYLYSKGHRRIGHVILPNEAGVQRHEVYLQFCMEHGLEPVAVGEQAPASILKDAMNYGKNCCLQILRQMPDVTAVFCGSDFIALGAMECLQELNRKIPEDVSVIGVGNVEYSPLPWFQLTTLELHRYEMGLKATDLLLGMIAGEKCEKVLMDTTLVERSSVRNLNQ
jgi:LacI family transcriptional regulator